MALTNGYLQIERVSGSAPYYAYAVINDQATSDGSFIPPSLVTGAPRPYGLTLPVIVETNSFVSELVLTNTSAEPKSIRFTYVADAIQNENKTANFAVGLKSFEQSIIPNLVQWLRDQGIPGIGPLGTVHVGPLFVTGATGENPVTGIFLGARTSTQGRGGHYGVFYPAVPDHSFASGSIWIDGLQQNANNRTNLALVNIGDRDENSSDVFRIELFDGETGVKVSTVEGVTVKPRSWRQLGSILANFERLG
jgi:hypothetical protein